MPNRKTRRRTKESTPQPYTPESGRLPPEQHQSSWWQWIFSTWWRIGAWAVAVVGFVATALSLRPILDVSTSFQPDQNRPYSEVFVVSNGGLLPLYNLEFTCSQDWFKDKEGNSGMENRYSKYVEAISRLGPGVKGSVQCRPLFDTPYELLEASISLVIKYQTLLPFYTAVKPFRFIGIRTKDSQMRWTPQFP